MGSSSLPDLKASDRSRYRNEFPIRAAILSSADPWLSDGRVSQLYIRNYYGGINSRAQAALAALYRAVITAPEVLPDVE